MISGGRPYPRLAAVLYALAILWLIATPIAYNGWVKEQQREYVGVLEPHRCWCAGLLSAPRQSDFSIVEIGNSGVTFGMPPPNYIGHGSSLDLFFKQMSLRIDYNKGQWIVSARILDKTTPRAVATLDEGEWHVSDKGESWDFNRADDALEVLSADQRVALQIRVFPDKVQLQGESWDESGRGMRVVGLGKQNGVLFFPLTLQNDPDEPRIQPIFKYPRQLHLGETVIPEIDVSPPPNAMCTAVIIFGLLVLSAPLFLLLSRLRRRFWSV